jgi:ABC-type transporter Mla maintaining outer membrane lipid asymmetry ATPase subunit MlaF
MAQAIRCEPQLLAVQPTAGLDPLKREIGQLANNPKEILDPCGLVPHGESVSSAKA